MGLETRESKTADARAWEGVGRLLYAVSDSPAGVDQVLRPRRLLAVDGDGGEAESVAERHFFGVVALEGGLDLGRDAIAELRHLIAVLLQERREQPAADAPGHPEVTRQLGGRAIEAAVDVDLLRGRRAVAAVLGRLRVKSRLHRRQDLARELAAARGVERERRARLADGPDQVRHEGRRARIDDVHRAERVQQLRLLRLAHDVDERHAVGDAELY